jgi:glycosyltransferase involved in cell wall biosynthesis
VNNTRISVAICTYNGSRFLHEQLQSIARQRRLPDEIVACDDGSTDDTIRLLAMFSHKVGLPVRIILNEQRLGAAKNFEKAISLCRGDIIVLADQDDIWRPDKLQRLVVALDGNPGAAYAFSDADMIDGNGALLGVRMWGAFGFTPYLHSFTASSQLQILLRQNLIVGASMAFRAHLKNLILPVPSGWMHDYWIVLLGSAISYGVPVPVPLLMYRRHAEQTCGWKKKDMWQSINESMASDEEVLLRKLEQFRELQMRLRLYYASTRYPIERLASLHEKELHLSNRVKLRSAAGLTRIRGVLLEAITGRYQRFSNSWLSIVRDLS